jgi:hypothetical protein
VPYIVIVLFGFLLILSYFVIPDGAFRPGSETGALGGASAILTQPTTRGSRVERIVDGVLNAL